MARHKQKKNWVRCNCSKGCRAVHLECLKCGRGCGRKPGRIAYCATASCPQFLKEFKYKPRPAGT